VTAGTDVPTPTAGRVPPSTYRLQITSDFTLDDAAAQVDYLAALGAGWIYLSPVLQAEPGSDHGYDVIDHGQVDPARGGAAALQRACDAAHAAGMGVLIDVVPNHVGVATPAHSVWWWDVLKNGPESRYREAFDVDWAAGGGKLLMPILGSADDLDALEIDGDELVYYDNRLPIAPGTAGGTPQEVHARQHYELIDWRRGDSELNYRRFFAVTTLAAIRVELPAVFDESHAEITRWIREGLADGLRIDHPDGVFDPAGYLDRLAEATGGTYVLVEKILEPGENLPQNWRTDGTTGYDAMGIIDRVLVDPAGEPGLTALDTELRGGVPVDWENLIHDTKRAVADVSLRAEVNRLGRLARAANPDLVDPEDALAELLACFPVYRTYLVPEDGRDNPPAAEDVARDEQLMTENAARAKHFRPDLADSIDAVTALLRDASLEVARRFQQTSGMVMAKGVEDCAFYRYTRLTTLTEVGADPSDFAVDVDEFHEIQTDRLARLNSSMVAMSTHDTKRSEDTRARISVLAELPDHWMTFVREVVARIGDLPLVLADGPVLNLVLQATVGAWPISPERLDAYALKASREAGSSTNYLDPNEAYEKQLSTLVERLLPGGNLAESVAGTVAELTAPGWSNSLSAKLIALTVPGVPDTYQGTELWDFSLVDPDNRRPVDYAVRRSILSGLPAAGALPVDETAAAKLLVTSRALTLRRDHPELFQRYVALTTRGTAAAHLVAYDRGGAVVLATRLPVGLAAVGGWADTTVDIPPGVYTDALTGTRHEVDGNARVSDLLTALPVALLVRGDK
jgi:(1->4)-alpha-D-glucan 1-alpha-D-glucosylmutase